jgi:phosphate transport system permease protein
MSSEQARVGAEQPTAATGAAQDQPLDLTAQTRPGEVVIQSLLFFCGFASIFTTLGIVYVLFTESLNFFFDDEVTLWEFLSPVRFVTGENGEQVMELAKWQPQIGQFSIWPLANSTFMITIIALIVAIPLGIGAAIFLSEYASPKVRNVLKPVLEILAGIPTVVYGYFALTFMTPLLQSIFGQQVVQIYNVASAGIVVGILLIPLIASMSEDSLSAVPRSLREASYGLGATRFETATKVVLPAALSGVIAALIVAISRAVGETMIVALAAGAGPNFTFNPFNAAETMTGHIARISGGDISYQSLQYNSIFAIGLALFVITLTLNIISNVIVRRFREVYE